MRVAGFGFRAGASLASLRDALAAAGGNAQALATISSKADNPALQALAAEMGLPIIAVAPDALAGVETITQSARALARFATGSLAEASALCAAGPGAQLCGPRVAGADRLAMVAIAEGAEQ